MKKTLYSAILALFLCIHGLAQSNDHQMIYKNAFAQLDSMALKMKPYNFKDAVFITENAFHFDTLNSVWFDSQIEHLATLSRSLTLKLGGDDYPDKSTMELAGKIFYAMTQRTTWMKSHTDTVYFDPYTYNFDDIWGEQDWSQMFVSKLLKTHKGNCHSLPYLYKIIAEELNVPAYMAFAPNHIFIKQYFQQNGWYNTELTNASFPSDAWLLVSGYTHVDAVKNSIYLDTLGNQESLAQCYVDLAKGFERLFPTQISFREKCIDRALEIHPKNINALLMKAEICMQQFQYEIKLRGYEPDGWAHDDEMSKLFAALNLQYAYLHRLGYRQMPKDMYLDWLGKLETEKEKYINQKISNEFKAIQTPSK
ncbi:hypothetical protein N7E81_07175 [Reichenbachiella carrageenanivorans]|uniref:Transglutaminase-like superfamily protein n=1 Tax=Reichenbachiella carrageenanivorans TaxID=2979869 RepID=A0ABY6D5L1_9BACT|nr:hypothetical protein [Reichenbachiella carrageenanivorans]UXX80880.1 hypothetical protein N7E81_07175 [Reichenbachiella carrageenanivorans]